MEEVNDEPLFDEHAELRRREEEARRLLISNPVNIPRRERQNQDVQLITETPKHNFTLISGENANKTYIFKNTSQQEIQEGSVLTRVEGHELGLVSRQIKRIAAGEIYKVEVDFVAPR